MGVRVEGAGMVFTYEEANDWFATSDGDLQVYQPVEDNPSMTIVEYARGTWQKVQFEPIPKAPKKEEENK